MTNYEVQSGMSSPIKVKRGGNEAHPQAPIKCANNSNERGYIEPRGYEANKMKQQAHDKAAMSKSKYKGGR